MKLSTAPARVSRASDRWGSSCQAVNSPPAEIVGFQQLWSSWQGEDDRAVDSHISGGHARRPGIGHYPDVGDVSSRVFRPGRHPVTTCEGGAGQLHSGRPGRKRLRGDEVFKRYLAVAGVQQDDEGAGALKDPIVAFGLCTSPSFFVGTWYESSTPRGAAGPKRPARRADCERSPGRIPGRSGPGRR